MMCLSASPSVVLWNQDIYFSETQGSVYLMTTVLSVLAGAFTRMT